MRSVLKGLTVAVAVVLVGLTALLATVAVKRASLPYENGRHFDVVYSVAYDESAIKVYALLALGCAMVSAALVFLTLRMWKKR
jgi:hypothetical protein